MNNIPKSALNKKNLHVVQRCQGSYIFFRSIFCAFSWLYLQDSLRDHRIGDGDGGRGIQRGATGRT